MYFKLKNKLYSDYNTLLIVFNLLFGKSCFIRN